MRKQFGLSLLVIAGAATAFAQRLPQTVIPSHYDLTITPDLAAETFRGEETIDVRVVQPVTAVTMHNVGLTLHDVRITSGGNAVSASPSLNSSDQTVTLTTAQLLAAGPATIAFTFEGPISSELRGLYLSRTPKRKYAVTQFESTDARRAFPCFDEPAMKATFDIALVVDKDDTAISNGRIVSDTPVGADKHRLRFSTTPKLSTYLVAMLVGDFDCIEGGADGIPIRVCGPPGRAAQLGQFALAAAEQSIKFYDSYYGIKYPFGKLDMIAIPDFSAGAMENAGAIVYRETAIFFDPKTSSREQSKRIAGVVAHEIAHQWFGDLVTMKWWDDIWLNEGFATFMSSKPLADWKPDWNEQLSQAAGTIRSLTIDTQRATRPIRTRAETPAEIVQLFDGIAYGKSAAVLSMVESWLGEETFRDGIRAYLKKYSWSNAAAEDFWGTMAAVSKQPVDLVMKSFIDQPGAPLLHASEACIGGKVTTTLTQERLLERGATAAEQTWTIPVCADGAGCTMVTGKSGTLTGGRCGEPVFLNRNGRGYYVTDYATDDRKALRANIAKLNDRERIAFDGSEWLLVLALRRSVTDYLDLLRVMPRPESQQLTASIAGHLEVLDRFLVTDQSRARWQRTVRGLMRGYAPLTWTAPSGETPEQKSTRATVLLTVGMGGDPNVIAGAKRIAGQYLDDPAAIDPTIAATALEIAAINGDAGFYRRLREKIASAPTAELLSRYTGVLTAFRNPELTQQTIDYTFSDAVRSQDLPRILSGLLLNPATRDAAWKALTQRWSELERKLGNSVAGLPAAMSRFCDPRSRVAIEKFFMGKAATSGSRSLKRSLESIDTCIAFRNFQEASFKQALTK